MLKNKVFSRSDRCVNELKAAQDIFEVWEAIDTDSKPSNLDSLITGLRECSYLVLLFENIWRWTFWHSSTRPTLDSKHLEANQDIFEIFDTKGTDQDSWKYLQNDADDHAHEQYQI